ncbi:MAG: hypothetical protein JWM40_2845 [Frankiales bacterium]|nr:hypothetical protein [Frankiales bacterium]
MPLSEHEQRLLDQIERALYAEDPKFASAVRSTDLRTHMRRRLRRAGAVFVIGFVTMLFGIANVAVGIAGFVVMLLALVLALSAWRRLGTSSGTPEPAGPARVSKGGLRAVEGGRAQRPARKKSTSSGSPLERLEERWKRRWDERGGPT